MERCKDKNTKGQPCRSWVWRDGFCWAHHPEGGDMVEVGRKGGLARPLTALRRSAAADADLREQARQLLLRAMKGEEVPKFALDAAKSLFSYRADNPPSDHEDRSEADAPLIDGRRPTSLADVLLVAADLHKRGFAPVPDTLHDAAKVLVGLRG